MTLPDRVLGIWPRPHEPFKGFRWQSAGDAPLSAGKTLLVGANGPVAVLNFYNHVMTLDESLLLVWYQQYSGGTPTPPVRLLVIQPNRLSTLGSLDAVFEKMNNDRTPVIVGGEVLAECSLDTSNCTDELRAEFPEQLQANDELLILCKSSGLAVPPGGEGGNLALLVARPREFTYRLYPQDWFNSGGMDYGYQWVTRVMRDRSTGRVQGDGFRIDPFTLDDSLRRLV